MSGLSRLLMLGAGEGWHERQLRQACNHHGLDFASAGYESLQASVEGSKTTISSTAGSLDRFDVVLTRTMPAGSMDRITLRLAILHQLHRAGLPIVNPPAALEIAIDKFATLSIVADLGYPVPPTRVVQSRRDGIDAFELLGGDCVVKPIFGGEGRGVMRVCGADLAFTVFSTLELLGSAIYLQEFIPPGGADTRLLKIGPQIMALRRSNSTDFRTNLSHGGSAVQIDVQDWHVELADRICGAIGLDFGSVDLIDDDSDDNEAGYRVVEVNAIPGWKGAQAVCDVSIADLLIEMIVQRVTKESQS